ncbi:MAG: DMT family transporter, partial [Actinobacteria bacterium]|nr:DMT family transporter [Actinomycetota bacterium]
VVLTWAFGVASIVTLLYGTAMPPLFDHPSLRSWVIVFLFPAFFAATFGHFCYVRALQLIPAERVASLVLSSPLFTALLAYPILSERLSSFGLVGFLLTLSGLYLVTRPSPESRGSAPSTGRSLSSPGA